MNSNNNNGFMNGFLVGAIVGAAVVFFLATKKGKKLLAAISEEGIENIADLADMVGENFDEEEGLPVASSPAESRVQSNGHNINNANDETKKSPVRRFFKGVSRRS